MVCLCCPNFFFTRIRKVSATLLKVPLYRVSWNTHVFSNSLIVKKESLKQERAEKETAYYVTGGASELKLHYLSMPRFFRTRGGMGAHWMVPSNVKLTNPNQPDPILAGMHSYCLNRSELEALLLSLYAAPEQCEKIVSNRQNSDKVVICRWLEQSKSQQVWDGLKQRLIQ